MRALKKVFWKQMPPERTELLHAIPRPTIHSETELGSIIKTTLESGEFVSIQIPKDKSKHDFPCNQNYFLDSQNEEWHGAKKSFFHKKMQVNELPGKPNVNQIQVVNKSELPIFIQPGTVFIGGSQNRVMLEAKLIRKGKTTLPVYCIEAGRWSEPTAFTELSRLPDLLSCKFLSVPGDQLTRQIKFWELILEALGLTKNENQEMNAMCMNDSLEETNIDTTVPKNARGIFLPDPKTGITIFRLTPGADHFRESISQWNQENSWRSRFRKFAPAARLYFRIFDDKKRLALKCHPDGKPYKTIRGKFDMFYYRPEDLENSFTPPVQRPPLESPISFENYHPELNSNDFVTLLKECKTTASRSGSNLISLNYQHPHLPLIGNGMLHREKLVCLEAMYFESGLTKKSNF